MDLQPGWCRRRDQCGFGGVPYSFLGLCAWVGNRRGGWVFNAAPPLACRQGSAYQKHQGGAIVWSPATGAHISVGAIRGLWAETGFEAGGLGYPVTDEVGGLRNGGAYQNYQGGVIVWSPATGAHISVGAIRRDGSAPRELVDIM